MVVSIWEVCMLSSLTLFTLMIYISDTFVKWVAVFFLTTLHVQWLCSMYLKYFQGLRAHNLHLWL